MKSDATKLYFEEVLESAPNRGILRSYIRIATAEEIEEAKKLHSEGRCPHTIVRDTHGWDYDFRDCAICGKGLGLV